MSLSLYLIIQQVFMGGIISLGIQLIFDSTPKELKDEDIYYSHKVMGVALCVLPVASFIYFFLRMDTWGDQYATAINLSAYSLTAILMGISYFTILNNRFNRKSAKANLAIGIAYSIIIWLFACFASGCVFDHALVIAYTLFCMAVISTTISGLIKHRKQARNIKSTKDRLKKGEFK